MQVPPLKDVRSALLADFGIPEEVIEHIGAAARVRHARHRARAEGHGHRGPRARGLRLAAVGLLGAQPRPRPVQGPLVRGRGQRQARRHHRRVVGHRRGGRAEDRRGRRHPAARRARRGEARGDQEGDRGRRAGRRTSTPPTSPTWTSIDELVEKILDDHPVVDILVNNAGRSIRRSIALSYDRFHDFERTMQLNYFGAIRLTMALLPHMRERKSGHVINDLARSARRRTRRGSARTSRRRRRSTRGRASSARR